MRRRWNGRSRSLRSRRVASTALRLWLAFAILETTLSLIPGRAVFSTMSAAASQAASRAQPECSPAMRARRIYVRRRSFAAKFAGRACIACDRTFRRRDHGRRCSDPSMRAVEPALNARRRRDTAMVVRRFVTEHMSYDTGNLDPARVTTTKLRLGRLRNRCRVPTTGGEEALVRRG